MGSKKVEEAEEERDFEISQFQNFEILIPIIGVFKLKKLLQPEELFI